MAVATVAQQATDVVSVKRGRSLPVPLRLFSDNRSGSSQVVHARGFVTTTGAGEGGESADLGVEKSKRPATLGPRHLRQVVVNDISRRSLSYLERSHVVVLSVVPCSVVVVSIWHP